MTLALPTAEEWAQRCAADGEFALASRHWSGGIKLSIGDTALALALEDGVVSAGNGDDSSAVSSSSGPVHRCGRKCSPRCRRAFTMT